MTSTKLTGSRAAALLLPRTVKNTRAMRPDRLWPDSFGTAGTLIMGVCALGGCINVSAPDEPIVIELNINIRQEVVYRLAQDAADTVEENADIF